MSAPNPALQGLERVRTRFVSLLADRQTHIAHYALAAWESESAEDQYRHLQDASSLLHMIAGTAGSLGFAPLGEAAQTCEAAILSYCATATDPQDPSLHAVIAKIDAFVAISQSLLDAQA